MYPNGKSDRPLKHLVIIDSVAGFETYVGTLDAFGLEQSRRARIAQCMRNTGPHCHFCSSSRSPRRAIAFPRST